MHAGQQRGKQLGRQLLLHLAALLSFLLSLFACSNLISMIDSRSRLHEGEKVNSLGLQRMFLQRYSREATSLALAFQLGDRQSQTELKASIEQTRRLLSKNFAAFLNGGSYVLAADGARTSTLEAIAEPQARTLIRSAQATWRETSLWPEQLATDPAAYSGKYISVGQKINEAIAFQDRAVGHVERQVTAAAERVVWLQLAALLIGVLAYAATLLYGRQRISEPFGQLYDSLQEHNRGQQRIIEERTAELRHAKERAEAASQAKSDFLAKVSHELRTPLNSVICLSDLLAERRRSDEHTREASRTIHSSATSLLNVIDDILDIAKIESGDKQLNEASFDVRQLIISCLKICQPLAKAKKLALRAQVPSSVDWKVYGDQSALRRMLANLLANAIKYTNSGYIELRARLEPVSASALRLQLELEDTGVGIAEDRLQAIFDRFDQADNSLKRGHDGLGLGLSIAHELVSLMSGEVSVESKEGVGSTFTLSIPLKRCSSEPVLTTAPGSKAVTEPGTARILARKARVLVVDDNELNRHISRGLLERLGFLHIDFAEDGQIACKRFESTAYQLVLMDCHMPVMDGFTATCALRDMERHTDLRAIVIGLSADARSCAKERCLSIGVDDFLTKPVDRPRFEAALARYFIVEAGTVRDDSPLPKAQVPQIFRVDQLEEYAEDADEKAHYCHQFDEISLRLIGQLRDCVDTGSHQQWLSLAHNLQGASSMIGAELLASVCKQARQVQWDERGCAQRHYEQIERVRERTSEAMYEQLSSD